MRCLPLMLAAAILGGCSGDDTVACNHLLCDVTDPDCVARTAEVVACDMAVEPAQPSVRYLTRAEVITEWEADGEPLTDAEAAALADFRRGQALLGHMPEGYEEGQLQADILANVAAYYETDTRSIVILDEGPTKTRAAYQTLVHELVHFYQDRRYDLAGLYETHGTTFPRALALRAVVEGDASFRDDLAGLELDDLGPNDVNWRGYFDDWQRAAMEAARDSEVPAVDVYGLFPYAHGAELVYDAWRDRDESGIASLFEQPPTSVRQVLGGYGAWPDELVNEDEALLPAAVPLLPNDYVGLGGGFMSAWLVQATLSRTVKESLWYPEASSIPAELMTVWRHEPSGGVAAFWRLRSTTLDDLTTLFGNGAWAPAEDAGDEARIFTEVDGDLVLVAVTEELDARSVLGEVTDWVSPQQANEAGAGEAADRAWSRRHARLRSQKVASILCPSRSRTKHP